MYAVRRKAIKAFLGRINSTPSTVTKQIPDEVWYKKTIDFSSFKVFGCKAMAMVQANKRKKLDKKSTKCIFIGYSDEVKGYRLYDKSTKKVIISRDVIFFEKTSNENTTIHNSLVFPSTVIDLDDNELREEFADQTTPRVLWQWRICQ